MTAVHQFELLLLLMAAVVVLELLARRLHWPPAAMLIIGGIALALIPGTPDISLDPDLALVLFLPPLLQASAFFTVWRDFKANLRIILQLAVGAVAFTTFAVGVVTHWVMPGLPWAACFALGAIVSPPDAVAAKAVLQRLPLPPRMVVLLEGESLLNDAAGLVLYRFAIAAMLTGAFSAQQAAFAFVSLSVIGVVAGIAVGYLSTWSFARLKSPELAILASFLAAWLSYIGAEMIGGSGVLSTVACGLVMGWKQHEVLNAVTRTQARAVWGVIVFVMESLIFILIGLSLRGVLVRLGGVSDAASHLLWPVAAIVLAVIVSRFIWMFPATYLPRLIPSIRRVDPFPPISIPIVMSWAGMRGVVSLAAALALPENFPQRDFILIATFAVILVTVLVQGMTLAPLIRLLRISGYTLIQSKQLSEHAARARISHAQLAEVEKHSLTEDGSHRHPRLHEQFSYRARAASRFNEAAEDLTPHRKAHFEVILHAVAAGRRELLAMRRSGEVHDSVVSVLEESLDLEEMSARRLIGEAGQGH